MQGTVNVDSVVLEFRRDERTGGARLHAAAREIMLDRSQGVLDPLHFVFAATVDDFAPERVKRLLARYEINRGRVQAAIQYARQIEHRRMVASDGEVILVNQDTEALYKALAFRRSMFDRENGEWSWYVTVIQLALESMALSIAMTLQHLPRD